MIRNAKGTLSAIVLGGMLVLAASAGCGQTLTVRVTRLRTLPPRDVHHTATARVKLREAASSIGKLYGQIAAGANANSKSTLWERRDEALALSERLKEPVPIMDLANGAIDLKEMLGDLGSAEFIDRMTLPPSEQDLNLDENKRRERTAAMKARMANWQEGQNEALRLVISADSEVARAVDKARFGGFQDNTVFRIDAGSKHYEKVKNISPDEEVVFAELHIDAVGDSGVMIVQESPAQVVLKGLAADPTEVVRNALMIVNKVLRIVNSFLPGLLGLSVGNVAGAIPSGSGTSSPASAAIEPSSTDDPVTAAAANAFAKLAQDKELLDLMAKVRDGTATEKDKEQIVAKVKAILNTVK